MDVALLVEVYAGIHVWIHVVTCVKLTVMMGALHVLENAPAAVVECVKVALPAVTVARAHVMLRWSLIGPVVASIVATVVVYHVGIPATPHVIINVVLLVNKLAQTIARLHVVDVQLNVYLDAGIRVLVLQMPILLSVELVTMVVHITVAHHHIKVVMAIVHGVVLYVKIIVHQIAVSRALKLSKAF